MGSREGPLMADPNPKGYCTVFLSMVCYCGFRLTARSVEALSASCADHGVVCPCRPSHVPALGCRIAEG